MMGPALPISTGRPCRFAEITSTSSALDPGPFVFLLGLVREGANQASYLLTELELLTLESLTIPFRYNRGSFVAAWPELQSAGCKLIGPKMATVG